MKKTLVLVMLFVVGLVFSAYAQVETKKSTKVEGDTTTQTTKVKAEGPAGTVKTKETVTTTPGETVTKTEVKGKDIDTKRTVTATPGKLAGTTQVDVKKGVFDDLKIDWTYEKIGSDYVLKYNVKESGNPNLAKELGMTPDQAKAIAVGEHKITSTTPQTAVFMQDTLRAYILKDLKNVKEKNAAEKKK